MSDEHDNGSVHVTPPIADLTDREAPTPGPLTKPIAIARTTGRRRPRWLILVIVLLVLVAAGGIIWSLSLGAASNEAIEYAIRTAEYFTT